MDWCVNCGAPYNLEKHHVIFRSECIALLKCEKNLVYLCHSCHQELHHGKHGYKINRKLKLEFQNYLEIIFDKEHFTKEDIRQALEITEKATDRLCKLMQSIKCLFTREDIIRSAMGGKLILEDTE